jgi:VanZ family protein
MAVRKSVLRLDRETLNRMITRWLAVFLWMLIIFTLSTDAFSSAHTAALGPAAIRFLIRKLAHWTEYFILGILLMRALLGRSSARSLAKRYMLWSIAVAALYAISDEWHQSVLASRNAQAVDVLIDAIGALCGTLSWYLRNPLTLWLIRSRIP